MEYLYAALGGAAAKIYDDLVADNDILQDKFLKEYLKGMEWMMLAALSMNDFNFSFIVFLISYTSFYFSPEEAWGLPYERALLTVYPFFSLLSFHTRHWFNLFDMGLLCIVFFCIDMEPKTYTEEVSLKKCVIRSIASFMFVCTIGILCFLPISKSLMKLMVYGALYHICSALFQIFCLVLGIYI